MARAPSYSSWAHDRRVGQVRRTAPTPTVGVFKVVIGPGASPVLPRRHDQRKVKPISRAARKGNGQIGDELLAHSCDQALRAQSRTARSGRRLTPRIRRSSAGCAHLPATNLPSADPWQQALSLLPSEPSHVVAPTAVPQHHRNAPCKGPPFGDTPSKRPRARARGGPYKGPRDVKASGYAS